MPVSSITYTVRGETPNLRITYRAVFNDGAVHYVSVRSSDPLFNPDSLVSVLTNKLNARIITNEIDEWLRQTEVPIILKDASKQDYANAIRVEFKNAEKEEAWRLAYKLYSRYQAGDFTAIQLRTAFGMSQVEFQAFAVRIQQGHDKWVELQGAVGE